MDEKKGLLSAGMDIARRNLRYIVWFYVLNVLFAWFGASSVGTRAHSVMDHSGYSDKVLHGFDLAVFVELINRPEMGVDLSDFWPIVRSTTPSAPFAILFLGASLMFMPGVLLGYSSDHRISRDEFFRACGRNLWRFVRLFLLAAVIGGIVASALYAAQDALATAADKTNYERLRFFTAVAGWVVIFLALTKIRIWFDLAQTDAVLRDQAAVRKSAATGFRIMRQNYVRLLGTYMAIALVGLAVLVGGILLWYLIVPPSSVLGAFLVGQFTMLLLLATRFWQRASAVAIYVKQMADPEMEMARVATPATAAIAVSQ